MQDHNPIETFANQNRDAVYRAFLLGVAMGRNTDASIKNLAQNDGYMKFISMEFNISQEDMDEHLSLEEIVMLVYDEIG